MAEKRCIAVDLHWIHDATRNHAAQTEVARGLHRVLQSAAHIGRLGSPWRGLQARKAARAVTGAPYLRETDARAYERTTHVGLTLVKPVTALEEQS